MYTEVVYYDEEINSRCAVSIPAWCFRTPENVSALSHMPKIWYPSPELDIPSTPMALSFEINSGSLHSVNTLFLAALTFPQGVKLQRLSYHVMLMVPVLSVLYIDSLSYLITAFFTKIKRVLNQF